MSTEPFLGQLGLFGGGYAPKGWAQCNGQLLPINQNQALFSLLGTMYGGDGRTSFALPNLRGRIPIHVGPAGTQGAAFGTETATLATSQMPTHSHSARGSTANANQPIPSILAAANNLYRDPTDLTTIHPQTISNAGGGQPHENRHPFLVLNWCIALQGIFPSRN